MDNITLSLVEGTVLIRVRSTGMATTKQIREAVEEAHSVVSLPKQRERRVDNALRRLKAVGLVRYDPVFRTWRVPPVKEEASRG